jgi:hypothetical protein
MLETKGKGYIRVKLYPLAGLERFRDLLGFGAI